MRRWQRAALAAIVAFTVAGSGAAPGYAAVADSTIEVQIWPEGDPGTIVLIVTAELPEGTELPATIEMPVPDGAEVIWVGELLGGALEDDPEREFTLIPGEGGGQALQVTVESLSVQYEALYPRLTSDGQRREGVIEWRQTARSKDVSFSVRLPALAQSVSIDPAAPGSPVTNAVGESLYTLPTIVVPTGETTTVSFSYVRGSLQPASGPGDNLVWWLLGAFVIAATLLVVAWRAQSSQAA